VSRGGPRWAANSCAFWLASEFGERSQYVRNIRTDPQVRLRGVRTFGTDLLTIRIDLID
jgi:hypothetical protein